MEPTTNMQDILALIQRGQWAPLAAILIGFLIWLTKDGTPTSLRVPPRLRLPLALLLGQAAGAVAAITAGVPVRDAIVGGLVASVLSWAGHELGVEKLRGGVELLVAAEPAKNAPATPAPTEPAKEELPQADADVPSVVINTTPES